MFNFIKGIDFSNTLILLASAVLAIVCITSPGSFEPLVSQIPFGNFHWIVDLIPKIGDALILSIFVILTIERSMKKKLRDEINHIVNQVLHRNSQIKAIKDFLGSESRYKSMSDMFQSGVCTKSDMSLDINCQDRKAHV